MAAPDAIDHDRLFKELLTTFFVEFVDAFLPDVAAYLDPATVEFLDKEVFTDITQGSRYESDLVVRARFRGAETFFLVLVESQSTAQGEFPKRMFNYFSRFYEKFDLPVYPVGLLSFERPARRQPGGHNIAFPGFVVNRFRFRVIQLNRLNWRNYLANPNPAATALMSRMRIAPRDRPRVKVQCLRLIATLRLDPARSALIAGFVHSYLRLSASEFSQFEQELGEISPQERSEMLTLTNEWIEEGVEKGRAGEARATLLRLGAKRFGAPAAAEQARIEAASLDVLEAMLDRLLDAADWSGILDAS